MLESDWIQSRPSGTNQVPGPSIDRRPPAETPGTPLDRRRQEAARIQLLENTPHVRVVTVHPYRKRSRRTDPRKNACRGLRSDDPVQPPTERLASSPSRTGVLGLFDLLRPQRRLGLVPAFLAESCQARIVRIVCHARHRPPSTA